VTHGQDERHALCDLLAVVGPDQPTLCAGWQTADLAAHLVLRERRPDAGAGVMGGPVARYTRRVQGRLLARYSFTQLVDLIRKGPPRLSMFGLPGADEKLNLVEFFVHHEDVLRAQPDWQPRKVNPELADVLWDRLSLARLMMRKAPVGVELVRADSAQTSAEQATADSRAANGATEARPAGRVRALRGPGARPKAGTHRVRITAKARTPVVTVTGDPVELTLWTMGRTSVADVQLDGADPDVAALRSDHWRTSGNQRQS
jgi:uncharacterized protein (TIGR03085 family)